MIVALGISGGQESDCTEGAGTEGIGRVEIVEQLYVGAKLQGKASKIRAGGAGNQR